MSSGVRGGQRALLRVARGGSEQIRGEKNGGANLHGLVLPGEGERSLRTAERTDKGESESEMAPEPCIVFGSPEHHSLCFLPAVL